MKKILKDYFSFNSRERVSILFLCCLMAFFWVLPNWYPDRKKMPEAPNWNPPQVDSEKILVKESAKQFETEPIKVSVKLFEFDPNTLAADGWKKLGISDKTIQTILHYREKGGSFRKPSDLKKIWGLSKADADRLMPYISIPEVKKSSEAIPAKPPIAIPKSILINQVTVEELEAIPGMNRAVAARMIKFRDKLGGFKNMEQVRKTYGLSDSVFFLMAPLLVF